MKEVKMLMSFDDTDPAGTLLVARFSTDEIRLLREYRRNAARLRETRIIRDGLPSSIVYKWTNVAGTVVENEDGEVDFELVGSFLHHLRPLFLSEEPASFEKIAGLIGRRFSHRLMKRHLKAIRSIAETSPFHAYGQITIGDVPLWDYKTLKKWLNAFEYHHDPEKNGLSFWCGSKLRAYWC